MFSPRGRWGSRGPGRPGPPRRGNPRARARTWPGAPGRPPCDHRAQQLPGGNTSHLHGKVGSTGGGKRHGWGTTTCSLNPLPAVSKEVEINRREALEKGAGRGEGVVGGLFESEVKLKSPRTLSDPPCPWELRVRHRSCPRRLSSVCVSARCDFARLGASQLLPGYAGGKSVRNAVCPAGEARFAWGCFRLGKGACLCGVFGIPGGALPTARQKAAMPSGGERSGGAGGRRTKQEGHPDPQRVRDPERSCCAK